MKTEPFTVGNGKKVVVSFPCMKCGKKVSKEIKIPSPKLTNEGGYEAGHGEKDTNVDCPCCGQTYDIYIEVNEYGADGSVTVNQLGETAKVEISVIQ